MGRLRGERAESDGGSDAATSVRIVNEDVPLAGRSRRQTSAQFDRTRIVLNTVPAELALSARRGP